MDKLKIILFTNWNIGKLVLETLSKLDKFEIIAVFTQYDGDNKDKYFNVVHQKATEQGYKIFNIYNKNSIDVSNEAAKLVNKERNIIGLSVSFNKIFKQSILEKINIINLHPSFLPKYRGPSPILWSILFGETEIGLTLHFVNEGIDTGNIITQIVYPLNYQLSFDQLTDDISNRGHEFIIEYLKRIKFPIQSTKQCLHEMNLPRIKISESERKIPLYELRRILQIKMGMSASQSRPILN